jgi:oxygen-independent coproporphyrinogen-3 oxidase
LKDWKARINRLSIGFNLFEEDLKWMNRAHTAGQALDSLQAAVKHFNNITVDLIYKHTLLTTENGKKILTRVLLKASFICPVMQNS